MSKETIVYEVKLQPAVIVLLGVIALGVVGNVFTSVLPIQTSLSADKKIKIQIKWCFKYWRTRPFLFRRSHCDGEIRR